MFVDFDQILQLPARYLQLLRRLVHGERVGDHLLLPAAVKLSRSTARFAGHRAQC